ncbi:conserved exported hypothetical protein [Verrucomicrobia bacterium]|nr:conserved exported hypothetical protein [Verrucomicrobiota bacterium]
MSTANDAPRLPLRFFLAAACLALNCAAASGPDARGGQFLGFKSLSGFEKSPGLEPHEIVLTSPVIVARIQFNQLVASWNVTTSACLKVEARAIYPAGPTKYYTLGSWSSDPARWPRESLPHQKDSDGDVLTDTLVLNRPADRVQLRLTLAGPEATPPKIKFLALCLTDTNAAPPALPPNRAAWGRTIPVPLRSQMNYPNGKVLCSPTTVSMIMTYWARRLNRPELDHDVPEIVKAIYDFQYKGTGNWPFNMAYAGSYPSLRAYITRFSDLSEVEDWIAAGLPVGLSVCSDRLHHRGPGPNGHLIVCVGLTEDGDPVVNDPGSAKNVRRIYPREDLIYAWAYSHNTVYLIYPEDSEIPADRFGHWDSWTARLRKARE